MVRSSFIDSGLDSVDVIAELAVTRELSRLVAQIQVEPSQCCSAAGRSPLPDISDPESAVAAVSGVDRRQARQIVQAAEHMTAQVDPQGHEQPVKLPAIAAAFTAGAASLDHVTAIARLQDHPVVRQLSPAVWVGIEQQIAAVADTSTPRELAKYGEQLVHAAHARECADDEDREPAQVNQLRLTPLPGGGGKIHGVIEDPVRYAMIATVLDAKAAPRTAEDPRTGAERAADALAEVCGFVADHGDDETLPSTGGRRPHLMVTVTSTDLENRARAACLDFGGHLSPAALRMLCCDAAVAPVVLSGAGLPLDVGRTERTIPAGIRKAITARDGGCAHPGCDRLPQWCDIHHIREWAHGGHTKVDNLVMLCRLHHREIHSTGAPQAGSCASPQTDYQNSYRQRG